MLQLQLQAVGVGVGVLCVGRCALHVAVAVAVVGFLFLSDITEHQAACLPQNAGQAGRPHIPHPAHFVLNGNGNSS